MIEAHDFRLQKVLGHGSMHQLIQTLYAQTDLTHLHIESFEEFRDLVSLMLNIFFKSVGGYFHHHQEKIRFLSPQFKKAVLKCCLGFNMELQNKLI